MLGIQSVSVQKPPLAIAFADDGSGSAACVDYRLNKTPPVGEHLALDLVDVRRMVPGFFAGGRQFLVVEELRQDVVGLGEAGLFVEFDFHQQGLAAEFVDVVGIQVEIEGDVDGVEEFGVAVVGHRAPEHAQAEAVGGGAPRQDSSDRQYKYDGFHVVP